MFYNLKKILCSAMLAVVFCLMTVHSIQAQGNVTLESNDLPDLSNDNPDFLGVDETIPDQLQLPEDEHDMGSNGLLTPSGVVSPSGNEQGLVQFDDTPDVPLESHNDSLDQQSAPAGALPPFGADTSDAGSQSSNIGLPSPTISPLNDNFGETMLSQIDNKLFSQMSDIEKQTALLTLELRREKIKNEIAAIKAQRQKAIEEEEAKKEEKERKRIEWEKEQEAKVIREKKLLEEVALKLERLRQQKVLKAYKESMLEANQRWIKNNAQLYEQIQNIEKDRQNIINNAKSKMSHLTALSEKAVQDAEMAKENYSREVKNLQTQISILKSRLEAEIAEKKQENDKTNPFAQAETQLTVTPEKEAVKLSDEYAIMEIRGKGENLTAKLINRGGDSFMIRKGTVLQSGHMVDEITQTYIRADMGGMKDYLYFAAGGILEKEPTKSIKGNKAGATGTADNKKTDDTVMMNQGVPSLGSGMFVR